MHTAIFARRSSPALGFSLVLASGLAFCSLGCDELDALAPTVATPTLIEIDVQSGGVVSFPGPSALNRQYEYLKMIGASDNNLAFCNLTAEGVFCERWNKDTRNWTPTSVGPSFLGEASSISVGGLLCALSAPSEGESCYDIDADTWTKHDEFMPLVGHFFAGVWAGRPIVNKSGELFAIDLAAKTVESLGSPLDPKCGGDAIVGEVGGELYAIKCASVHRYSPNDKSWVVVATEGFRPPARMSLVVGDKLCAVDIFERVVGCFEPATSKVTLSTPASAPKGWVPFGDGLAHSWTTAGGRIYASFTYTDPDPLSEKLRKIRGSVQEYNLETDTWTEKLSTPDGSLPEMATLGGRVYAIGTLNSPIISP
jgi:hypothetical protein